MAKSIIRIFTYLLLAFFTWLMIEITARYIPMADNVAFLAIKQQYIGIIHWKTAFFIHVYSSVFVLIAGFTQFSSLILRKWKVLHRWMGKLYVLNILFITGPSAFIMALYANGGLSSRFAFGILAVLWLYFTAKAWILVKRKAFKAHKNFMLRSYALTFSAVTLRVWKWLIVLIFHPGPMDVYMIVAWLGWIPNLLVIEWYIRKEAVWKMKKKDIVLTN